MVVKPNYCLHCGFVTTLLGIIIICLCIHPSTQVLNEKYRNDFYNTVDDLYCLTPQGASGKCLAIHECPESKKLILSNVKPKICAWIVRIPIICCPLHIPFCGTRIIKKNRYRIVGGTEAYPGEFPWSAALFSKSLDGRLVHECGGTIISDRHILTAAHCFTTFNVNNYVIGVGSGLLWRTLKYEIKSIITHPTYNPAYYYSDIALIETKTDIKFNIFVRPVCLPYKNLVNSGDEVSIAGWGYLNYNGQKSDVLNKAHLNIISRKTCNATYSKHRSNKIPTGITDHFICAGAPDYSRDACEADSGGALLKREMASFRMPLKEYESRFVQIGIVSFGYKCAHDGYPGVYTDVAHFIHWIKENVDLRSSKSPPLL
ncbi:Clotting factor B-like protein [Leptotrombidium deliense]|uniref:Clotting factor B-like protein n=1 Tax=Leptotrombidium deliense TaxID=299467 RepID=A0A443SET4_9ACAR|nr:Clotting factor B-like protein [Leptotrombidium deliense]